MIADLSREKAVAMGRRLRADYFVEQSGRAMSLAGCDGAVLAAVLPDSPMPARSTGANHGSAVWPFTNAQACGGARSCHSR